MVRVEAVTMRMTREVLPRYGVSSCLRNSQSQVRLPPMSTASNDDDGRLADPKQVGRRVLHTDADWIPGGEMHPVEGALYVGQARLQTAEDIRVRSHAEADAIYDTGKADVGLRHEIHICRRR
jgi:hypothetical protein